jgi:hypothetical protein
MCRHFGYYFFNFTFCSASFHVSCIGMVSLHSYITISQVWSKVVVSGPKMDSFCISFCSERKIPRVQTIYLFWPKNQLGFTLFFRYLKGKRISVSNSLTFRTICFILKLFLTLLSGSPTQLPSPFFDHFCRPDLCC